MYTTMVVDALVPLQW